jgi:hypothetical protein
VVGALISAAADGSSSACGDTSPMLGGWDYGSGETTCALSASRFRGPRLSTPVSAWLQEAQKSGISKRVEKTE